MEAQTEENFDSPPPPPFPGDDFRPEETLEVPEGCILEPGLPDGIIPSQDGAVDDIVEDGEQVEEVIEDDDDEGDEEEYEEETGVGFGGDGEENQVYEDEIEFDEGEEEQFPEEEEEVQGFEYYQPGNSYSYGEGRSYSCYSYDRYQTSGSLSLGTPIKYPSYSPYTGFGGGGYGGYGGYGGGGLGGYGGGHLGGGGLGGGAGNTLTPQYKPPSDYKPYKPKPYKKPKKIDFGAPGYKPYKPKAKDYQPTKFNFSLGKNGNSYIPGYKPSIVDPNKAYEYQKPDIPEDDDDDDMGFKSFIPKRPTTGTGSVSFVVKSSRYEQIKAKHGNGNKYTDREFPPNLKSIAGFDDNPYINSRELAHCKWLRPEQFFGRKTYKVFSDSIEPNDILQGFLGDCFFLSAIAAIAEFQHRIKKLFLTRDQQPSGAYCVAICVTGNWEEVILDDLFPCDPRKGNEPVFNTTKTKELWVMLLEKAYAKVFGGFINIDAGTTTEALNDLTGCPTAHFDVKRDGTPDDHWKNIFDAEQQDYIMCCCTGNIKGGGAGDDSIDGRIGIAGNHAYSLLGAYEITRQGGRLRAVKPKRGEKKNRNNTRIVKIRNPWGTGEWKGSWRDNDSRWTPELRKDLEMENKDDGIFCMEFRDFLKYYADYQICYYEDNYEISSNKYNGTDGKPTVIEFDIGRGGFHYFSINQNNRRFYPQRKRYTYSELTLIVAQKAPNGKLKYIGLQTKKDKSMWFKANCAPGAYVAIVITPWVTNVKEFGFSVYGPAKTNLKLTGPSALPQDWRESVIIERAQLDRTGIHFYRDGVGSKSEIIKGAFAYIYFENSSRSTTLKVRGNKFSLRGVEVFPKSIDTGNALELTVEPGQKKAIVAVFKEKYSRFDAKAFSLSFC